MKCRDALRLSTAYLDGELDSNRSSAVRGHLRTCSACREAVEDEAMLRDSAAELPVLDPPPELWAGIEKRLAEEEIADANRSRMWIWWQAARPHIPIAAAAVGAAVLLSLWLIRRDMPGDADTSSPDVAQVDHVEQQAVFASAQSESHLERAMRQINKADDHYLATIAELRDLAEKERPSWTDAERSRFDKRVAEFDRVTLEHRKRLAYDESGEPATRDDLFALYRAEIAFLQRAAVGEP